jgi:hypothetical protein
MPKLYEISSEMQKVEQEYMERLGALEESLEAGDIDATVHATASDALLEWVADTLDGLDASMGQKLEGLAKFLANLEQEEEVNNAMAAPFQRQADAYKANAKRAGGLGARLKQYAVHQLQRAGKVKVDTGAWVVRRQVNGQPSIVLMAVEDVPEGFLIPQEPKLDRQQVLERWKAAGKPGAPGGMGAVLEDVPGVEVRRGEHLRTKPNPQA